MRNRYIVFGSLLLWMMALSGCGKDESFTAPSDSLITIFPDTLTVNNPDSASSMETVYFTIAVENSDGTSLEKTELSIFFPQAVPNSLGYVQLYDGSTSKDSPFPAITNNNGVYFLRFDYQSGGGLSYEGDLEVRSGSNFGTATFTVTSEAEE